MRDGEWLRVGAGVAAVGWGANQFAPLLSMYRSELGVSAARVQAMYGIYAIGLVPGLLLSGPLSDRYGRRRIVLWALVISLVASLLLMAGGEVPVWLFVGRLVAGFASGAAFSAGTAWIKELSTGDGRERGSGARRATVAMTMGFAGGPLVAGVVAQWAPVPTFSAYLPHLGLTTLAIPLAMRARETRVPSRDVPLWSPARLPTASRRRFRRVVMPLAPWVFGASSIGLAYMPGLIGDVPGDMALLFSAVVTASTMLAGILVQPLARFAHRASGTGLMTMALGMVMAGLLLGVLARSHPLLIAASALVLGAGYGCCLVAGLTEIHGLAEEHNLARVTAVFQAIAYLGFGASYLLAVFESVLSPGVLLSVVAVFAGITLAWVRQQAARNPV